MYLSNNSANVIMPEFIDSLGTVPRSGTNTKGFAYEAKICALFTLRGTIQDHVSNFQLLQNIDSSIVGNFDDIIFEAEPCNGTKQVFTFQLKHFDATEKRTKFLKLAEFKDPKSKLYLPPYLDIIRKSKFVNVHYVIFTNKNIDTNDLNFKHCLQNICPPIFNVGGEVFKLNGYDNTEPEVLEKLLIFSSQNSEEDVNQLIQNALVSEVGIEDGAAEDVTLKYVEYIRQWISGGYGGIRSLKRCEVILKLIQITFQSNLLDFALDDRLLNRMAAKNWAAICKERIQCLLVENCDDRKHFQELSVIAAEPRRILQDYLVTDWKTPVSDAQLRALQDAVFSRHLSNYTNNKNVDDLCLTVLVNFLSTNKKHQLLFEVLDTFINERMINCRQDWRTRFSGEELQELKTIFDDKNVSVAVGKKTNMDKLYNSLRTKGCFQVLTQLLTGGIKNKRFITESQLKDKLSDREQRAVKALYLKYALENIFGRYYELNAKTLWWYLWWEEQVPIILRVKDSSANVFAKLMPKSSHSFVLISNGTLESTRNRLKKAGLKTLYHFEEIGPKTQKSLLALPTQLQGRKFKFGQVICKELLPNVKTLDIVTLCLGNFTVGIKNYLEPPIFIDRQLRKLYVSEDAFKRSIKIIFMCNRDEIDLIKQYFELREPNINFKTDVCVLNKQDMYSDSKSDQQLGSSYLSKHNVFLILDISLKEIKTAVDNRNATNETYYLYHLANNEILSADDNPPRTINVLIVPENKSSAELHLSNNNYENYKFSEIDFPNIPLTCVNIISSDNEGMEIAKFHRDKNILFYYLSKDELGKRYEFLGSTKDSSSIRKHITQSNDNILNMHKLLCYNDLLLISGEPGMGKTILANYFVQSSNQHFLTIFISCNSLYDHVKTRNLNENLIFIENLKSFLKYDNCNDLEQIIFNLFIKNRNVILIVDGFDEVHEDVEKQISEFLKEALRLGFKVILTTRSVTITYLQDTFLAYPRTIAGFTKNDQTDYLTQYLITKFPNESEKIQHFVKDTIKRKRNSAWDTEFAGVALQTHMLSQIYAEEFINGLNHTGASNFVNKPFDVIDLYERFIELKLTILKSKPNLDRIASKHFKHIVENSLEEHKRCALKAIFNKVPSSVDITKFCEEYDTSIGLIDRFLENHVPVFVHRTYAEFLCAKYFSENFQSTFVQVLYESLFNSSIYDIIRKLTDKLLADGCQLHLAILNADTDTVQKTLLKQYFPTMDNAGRHPLKLAMAWGVRQELVKDREMNGFNTFGQKLIPNVGNGKNSLVVKLAKFDSDQDTNANLEYGLKSMSLRNVNDYLGIIHTKFHSFVKIKDTFLGFCKLDENENYKRLLFTCCVHNFNFIFKAAIVLNPNKIKISKLSFDVTNDKTNLLHVSSYFGANDVIEIILENSIDVNCTNYSKYTPLHYAIRGDKPKTVELLLQNGADPNLANNIGTTPYAYAVTSNMITIAKIIESNAEKCRNKLNVNRFYTAVGTGNVAEVNRLLESGENPNQIFDGGFDTPLIVAASFGKLEIVEMLLTAGAEVNKMNEKGRTALMHASLNGRPSIVRHLLQNDANVNLKDDTNETALHGIAYNAENEKTCLEIADLLTEMGAEVNSPANSWTPLMEASRFGNVCLVKFLLSKGADANATYGGEPALYWAIHFEHEDVAKILRDHASQ